MYRAPSKKRQLIIRTGVYSLMTILVLLLVTFLVFIMLGYRFNRDTNSIQQGGLVKFDSHPIDAKVTIGTANLTDLTPSKITVNPGNYDVTMSRNGYKPWSKNVDVKAGEVLWLNYTQLTPNKITTDRLTQFDSVVGVKSSPNGDRFAVLTDASKPTVTFLDINGSTPKQSAITVPESLLPADKTPTFELVEWSNDSDRMLVKMTYDSMTEFLVIDRRDADKAINLSKAYDSGITEVLFDPRSSERMIIRTANGDVRTIDTIRNSLSSVITSSVTSMSIYGNDAILLVTPVENGQAVSYVSLGSSKVRELKRVSSAEKTQVSIGKYYLDTYVAISTGAQLDTYKLKSLPSSESEDPITMTNVHSALLPGPAEHLSVRSGGRFVIAQYSSGVQTYDIELDKQTDTSFKTATNQELRWLDKYHFYTTSGTSLNVSEFDGANSQRITSLVTNFDAVQSDDNKFIYTINAIDSGFALQRSRMILE